MPKLTIEVNEAVHTLLGQPEIRFLGETPEEVASFLVKNGCIELVAKGGLLDHLGSSSTRRPPAPPRTARRHIGTSHGIEIHRRRGE